ncbi:hypothetical protein Cgig2_016221 [Carnegiea gigantea]|uniref:Uncharacterized protein n=1 Tax=Carnegiea gigantea TaxID=171969 RepID=A0A9Q1GRX2_9CARY|nr:hypothetical protein Cgig2_016221 [Carnegiea gigantea]
MEPLAEKISRVESSNDKWLERLPSPSNSFTGEILLELKDLANLAVLNLAGNRFSGQILTSLYLCAYLNVSDLHSNQLTRPMPQQLSLQVGLSTFGVSYNKLSGMLPLFIGNLSDNLPRFNALPFQGNKGLYRYPLELYKNKGLSTMATVLIGSGSGLLSLIVSFTVVCVWLKERITAARYAVK